MEMGEAEILKGEPDCSKCGGKMRVKVNMVRIPEVFLACDRCKHYEDMTVDQYYGRAPQPEWATPKVSAGRIRPDITVRLIGKPDPILLEAFQYGEVRKYRTFDGGRKPVEFEAYILAICDHVPSGGTSIELKYAT